MEVKYAGGDWVDFLTSMRVNMVVAEPATHAALVSFLRSDDQWLAIEDDPVRFIALRKKPCSN